MQIIDSHTGGEPTRLIVSGGPDLGRGSMAERKAIFADQFDHLRRFAVNEPRGFDAMVGALLCEPVDPSCAAGLIFFNNVGYLGMCGHGTIGAVVTLAHMGRIQVGKHCLETPVGVVTAELIDAHTVRIDNVPSYRYRHGVPVQVPGIGLISGDVAWGGNWFFLTQSCPIPLKRQNIQALTDWAQRVKAALTQAGITGRDGAEIDHIELMGTPEFAGSHSRNFVLCPGGQYDRSPCGTGTSAKLACLAASYALSENTDWIQESIVGSRFVGRYRREGHHGPDQPDTIVPTITGTAYVVSQATLLHDASDPFAFGIS
jgi:4-hydroxyproline epimerase